MALETPARIEPCGIEETAPVALTDLILEVRSAAEALGRNLHPDSAAELCAMTRIMNAYYSNLIEGHDTPPRDIEAALAGRFADVENVPLAKEAAAHVQVQSFKPLKTAGHTDGLLAILASAKTPCSIS
jgi:Fic family protein